MRFVPLNYYYFKRLAVPFKRAMGVQHCAALEIVSRASGFMNFHEVTAWYGAGMPGATPNALQRNEVAGYDVWCCQARAVVGDDVMSRLAPELEFHYRRAFEPIANWVEPASPEAAGCFDNTQPSHPLRDAPLEAGESYFSAISAPTCLASVRVTYRRQRVVDPAVATSNGPAAAAAQRVLRDVSRLTPIHPRSVPQPNEWLEKSVQLEEEPA